MRKLSTARSSRRAPALKDDDYDHEIDLVDRAAEAQTPKTLSPEPSELLDQTPHDSTTADPHPEPGPSSSRIAPARESSPRSRTSSASTKSGIFKKFYKGYHTRKTSSGKGKVVVPTVEVNEPTPIEHPQLPAAAANGSIRSKPTPDTAFDVLYENQRGGFLCSRALFSPKALGQLDPPAWTNFAHKPSPTNIETAQVPDPSWIWAWPEWHVNKDQGVDEDGWEYSFMFTKMFSWHGPRWYNSFVRRRAWVRKRVRRDPDSNDPHMLNTDYFTVRPSNETGRSATKARSRLSRGSASMSMASSPMSTREQPDIEDIDTLMAALRRSRIDREKIEAVRSFLEHGGEELIHLQRKMHDIMAMFVFQASRRVLLSKLNEVFEETRKALEGNDTGGLQRRSNYLKAAIRHADEECKRLEYWSDLKSLVQKGSSDTTTDKCAGWDES